MAAQKPYIDPYLFDLQFDAFRAFVEDKRPNARLISFASHPYICEQEGYKSTVHVKARDKLGSDKWKKSEIGTGKIIRTTIEAIEIPDNNLLLWQSRYGDEARSHRLLYGALSDRTGRQQLDSCLFGLYRESHDAESFSELVSILGKKYSFIAYLFFLKDWSKYVPIAPTYFDRAFGHLGVEFRTSHCCSWENYSDYVGLLGELKFMLGEALAEEVTLLDAHSFGWILASQMGQEGALADNRQYLNLSETERHALVKARLGQGKFRDAQVNYWGKCAVTGCQEKSLLIASHIKPWSKSSPTERSYLYNGLLLSPGLDACFDAGFVSFDNEGKILLSTQLSQEDLEAMGLHSQMRLSRIEPEHRRYLTYHRDHVYRENWRPN